jgi:hypothetical protein
MPTAAMIIMVARSTRRPNTGHRACGRSTGHESGSSEPAARPPRGASTPIAFFEKIMVKSYETLVDSDTKVDVNTGIVAAGRLRSLIDSRDYDHELLVMKVQVAAICDAVKSTVPQEMWSEIIEKLDEAEQHSQVLDVEYDCFDDADDDAFDPTEFIDDDDEF